MKRIYLLVFLVFCLTVSEGYGQTWLWAYGVNNGTNGLSEELGITVDDSGNVYEAGDFNGTVTFGTISVTESPNEALYLTKFDNNGNALWVTTGKSSTSGGAYPCALTTDIARNVYVTGQYICALTMGTFSTSTNYTQLFLAKYSAAGVLQWGLSSSNIGNNGQMYAESIHTDVFGNVYIAGYFNYKVKLGAFTLNNPNGFSDLMFIAKVSSSGNVLWVKTQTNFDFSYPDGLVCDSAGNVYVAGTFGDTLQFGTSIIKAPSKGNYFITKFDSSGNFIWLDGGNVTSNGWASVLTPIYGGSILDIDKVGNLYITGQFLDSLRIGRDMLYSGTSDNFVAKYTSAGAPVWGIQEMMPHSKFPGYPCALSCDKRGGLYISGIMADSVTFGSVSLISDSLRPSFLFKLDTAGNTLCGNIINDNNFDNNDVVADPLSDEAFLSGNIYPSPDSVCYFGRYFLSSSVPTEFAYLTKWICYSEDGINETKAKNSQLKVFPNPTNGIFTIHFVGAQNFESENIEIYTVFGQKVNFGMLKQVQYDYEINLSSQPDGLYFYRVMNQDGSLAGEGKIVKD